MRFKDLQGRQFGKLFVLERAENSIHGKTRWLCQCSCGVKKAVLSALLLRGEARSCGCSKPDIARSNFTKHGMSGTRTYVIWQNMLARCRGINRPDFSRYGGKKIKVCKRWQTFENFFTDMGECPPGLSIDRIDNSKGYEPENCRWATDQEQSDNRQWPVWFTFNGKTMNKSQWARELGINDATLHERLQKWPIEDALSLPKQHRWSRKKKHKPNP